MPKKTIKEVTELTGVTGKALRYYDDKDVLHPSVKKSHGRREWLYDEDEVLRLKQIVLYKETGLPIESIRQIMNDEDCNVQDILSKRLEELKSERAIVDNQLVMTELLLAIEGLKCDGSTKLDLKMEISKSSRKERKGNYEEV